MSFSKNLMKNKHGFTLLEILVVISIIGILIAIGAAAFSTAQKKGRDARRRADMKQYQNAFEQYYSENTGYGSCADMELMFTGGAPSDPKNSVGAYNCSSPSDTGYCVCALLDSDGTGNANADAVSSTCSFGTGTGADYFCVQNLQ